MTGTAAYSSAVYSAYEAPEFSKGDPASYELDSILGKIFINPSSIPAHLPRPWVALTSYDNVSYFFNPETKEIRRTRPSVPKAKSGESSPKTDDAGGPEDPKPDAGPETGVKESTVTATGSTIPSDVPAGASHESPESEGDHGSEVQQSTVSSETGVKECLNAAMIEALDSDALAGASDDLPGDTTTQQPSSPALRTQLQDADKSTMTPPAVDATSGLEASLNLSGVKNTSHLNPPEDPARPDSPSGRTLVNDDCDDCDDEHVESATKPDDYAPAFRLQLRTTTDNTCSSREDHVFGHELEAFDDPKTEKNTINLCFVANDTQMNSIYASEQNMETIIARYGLQTKLQRLSASPQMGTFQLFEPLSNGDFIFTCRCATGINASTIVCYRYQASSQSIFGLVVDRRERSQVLIDILKTFDLGVGLPLLPAVALAQASLHFNIRAVKLLESTYYLNKLLERGTQATAEGPVSKESTVFIFSVLDTMFNGVFGVSGCLEISIKSLKSLTAMIRDQDKEGHFFDSVLNAIDSESQGHSSAAARTQARTHQRHMIYAASVQTTFLQQAHEANVKRNQVLNTTKDATAASVDTLATMQKLLSDTQELGRKTEEVTRVAADYGKLVFAVTCATFAFGVVSACAEFFSLAEWPVRFSPIPLVSILAISIAVFGCMLRNIRVRAKASDSDDKTKGEKSEAKVDENKPAV